jgi:capsule polysaccharide export protein KpsC/LpsZ
MVSWSQQLQLPKLPKSRIIFRMRQRLPPIKQTVCSLRSDLFCICLSLWHRISQSVTQSIESNLSHARQVPCQTFVLTQPRWRFNSLFKLRMKAQGISKTCAEVSVVLIKTLNTRRF